MLFRCRLRPWLSMREVRSSRYLRAAVDDDFAHARRGEFAFSVPVTIHHCGVFIGMPARSEVSSCRRGRSALGCEFETPFTQGHVMKKATLVVALLIFGLPPLSAYSQSLTCGLKPLPELGCRIGRCVNGAWEQVCDSSPSLSCGLKPLPDLGCRIGRCVGGSWEQICDQNPSLSCGLKPLPNLGCRIGRCVGGVWEQVCN